MIKTNEWCDISQNFCYYVINIILNSRTKKDNSVFNNEEETKVRLSLSIKLTMLK